MFGASFIVAWLTLYAAMTAYALQLQRYSCGTRRNSSDSGRGFTWTGAEYRFECDTVDELLRDRGQYVPKNNIALRGQICGDDLYLAYPR